MKWILIYIVVTLFLVPILGSSQNIDISGKVVEFSGVTMTSDSLQTIPEVSISVKGQNRGTLSNDLGVFSIVAYKGDIIHFSAIGFHSKNVKIPKNLIGDHFSSVQFLKTDTVYLPETVVRPFPTQEEFAREFVNYKFPDDQYEIARRNTEAETMRSLSLEIPSDAREATSAYLNQQALKISYNGQLPPENIFNPLAWAQFIQAWKNGDFKKKD